MMMDIYSHYNGKLGLICFIVYLIMLIKGRKTINGTALQSNNYSFIFWWMLIYSVLGFLEYDTYHYYILYEQMFASGSRIHVEHFYFWLEEFLPHSFLLWRSVIWGGACILFILLVKHLRLNANVLAFFIPFLLLRNITLSRESLGICLMLFSGVLLISSIEKKKFLLIVLAVLGLFGSSFLHKSLIIFIVLYGLSFFIPLNKRIFIISLIIFPFLYISILAVFKGFSSFDLLREDQSTLIAVYQETESEVKNLNGLIFDFVEKSAIVMFIFIISKKYLFDKIKVSKTQFSMYKYAYLMAYVSFLFYGQEISHWISYRTMSVCYFPLVLCAANCFDSQLMMQKRRVIEIIVFVVLIIVSVYNDVGFIRNHW